MNANKNIAITIGRQFASGGQAIGKQIAEELGFAFYDKNLVALAAEQSGLCKELFKEADERASIRNYGAFFSTDPMFFSEGITNMFFNSENLFQIQSDVILQLAQKQSCVFVGRCADYVLRDQPNVLNVFITANIDERIARAEQRNDFAENIKDKAKRSIIEKYDNQRAHYYTFFTDKKWGDINSYHLTLNSGLLGIEGSAKIISEIVKRTFAL